MGLFNDVQLCREMGWTLDELDATDDDFVFACQIILGAESDKARDDARRNENPHSRVHHQVG